MKKSIVCFSAVSLFALASFAYAGEECPVCPDSKKANAKAVSNQQKCPEGKTTHCDGDKCPSEEGRAVVREQVLKGTSTIVYSSKGGSTISRVVHNQ